MYNDVYSSNNYMNLDLDLPSQCYLKSVWKLASAPHPKRSFPHPPHGLKWQGSGCMARAMFHITQLDRRCPLISWIKWDTKRRYPKSPLEKLHDTILVTSNHCRRQEISVKFADSWCDTNPQGPSRGPWGPWMLSFSHQFLTVQRCNWAVSHVVSPMGRLKNKNNEFFWASLAAAQCIGPPWRPFATRLPFLDTENGGPFEDLTIPIIPQ